MGHAQTIRSVEELRPHFRSLLLGETRFRWKEEQDGTLICSLNQASARFRPMLAVGLSSHQVENLARLTIKQEISALVVVPSLSGQAYEACRARGISCLDLNGRLLLQGPGFLVDRPGATAKRFRTGFPARRLFAGRACRLARVLLTQPGVMWAIRDLAREAKLSVGTVQSLLAAYHREGLIVGTRGDWRVASAEQLLNAWRSADQWGRRVTEFWFHVEITDWRHLCGQILVTLGRNAGLTFTQFAGAALRTETAMIPWLTFYTMVPAAEVGTALGWQPGRSQKGVLVLNPKDPAVADHGMSVGGLPVCCDPQIYVDLLAAGTEYFAQADEFRNWPGFLNGFAGS